MKLSLKSTFTLGALALAGAAIFFTGCNTIKGVGKDIQGVGRGLQKAANKSSDNSSAAPPSSGTSSPSATPSENYTY